MPREGKHRFQEKEKYDFKAKSCDLVQDSYNLISECRKYITASASSWRVLSAPALGILLSRPVSVFSQYPLGGLSILLCVIFFYFRTGVFIKY
jgi:hypothetical protein